MMMRLPSQFDGALTVLSKARFSQHVVHSLCSLISEPCVSLILARIDEFAFVERKESNRTSCWCDLSKLAAMTQLHNTKSTVHQGELLTDQLGTFGTVCLSATSKIDHLLSSSEYKPVRATAIRSCCLIINQLLGQSSALGSRRTILLQLAGFGCSDTIAKS
jgi:hypothetical protein